MQSNGAEHSAFFPLSLPPRFLLSLPNARDRSARILTRIDVELPQHSQNSHESYLRPKDLCQPYLLSPNGLSALCTHTWTQRSFCTALVDASGKKVWLTVAGWNSFLGHRQGQGVSRARVEALAAVPADLNHSPAAGLSTTEERTLASLPEVIELRFVLHTGLC